MREIDSQDMPIFTFRDAEIPQKKETSLQEDIKREANKRKGYIDMSVKSNLSKIGELLDKIPADCCYNDWFKVAAALKNEKIPFEIFQTWSEKA